MRAFLFSLTSMSIICCWLGTGVALSNELMPGMTGGRHWVTVSRLISTFSMSYTNTLHYGRTFRTFFKFSYYGIIPNNLRIGELLEMLRRCVEVVARQGHRNSRIAHLIRGECFERLTQTIRRG